MTEITKQLTKKTAKAMQKHICINQIRTKQHLYVFGPQITLTSGAKSKLYFLFGVIISLLFVFSLIKKKYLILFASAQIVKSAFQSLKP